MGCGDVGRGFEDDAHATASQPVRTSSCCCCMSRNEAGQGASEELLGILCRLCRQEGGVALSECLWSNLSFADCCSNVSAQPVMGFHYVHDRLVCSTCLQHNQ